MIKIIRIENLFAIVIAIPKSAPLLLDTVLIDGFG